jgi:formate hydrogenlyase subunit 3/multisubunit Na+/H+ antiporter MnhD subunit
MTLLLAAIALLTCSALLALVAGRSVRLATIAGLGGAVAGGVIGAIPAMTVLAGGPPLRAALEWQVPFGSFTVELDALSAWFLVPVLGICTLAAVYGSQYMPAHGGTKPPGSAWFFFNLLTASMVLVLIARNAVLFLLAWEVMSLASFFLVIHDDEKESVRQAGWIYLVATHLGTAFLLVLFILLGQGKDVLDFAAFAVGDTSIAGILFLLAVVGFGTKAGFLPLHVWLPEAHPAAPSHVSAVMSGVMIKMGIYGLLRTLTFLGPPSTWWGWVLIGIGLTSGILGVLFALAQHDLKRLLAYHSVENIGIIALGLGIGVIGQSSNLPSLALLGYGGGLLHDVNHALFKALLFLGAGSVLHATGTAEMEQLGGLIKKMPATAVTFLIGAIAIVGLPPLNGFASEYLIYLAALEGEIGHGLQTGLPLLAVIVGLGLIGGLAAACFAKAFGIVFLGSPRSGQAVDVHPPGRLMLMPMLLLSASCITIGLFAWSLVPLLSGVAAIVAGLPADRAAGLFDRAASFLIQITTAAAPLLGLIAGLAILRWWLLHGRSVIESETWGCGYAEPTARMQYTASSFAQPITSWFRLLLQPHVKAHLTHEPFPDRGEFHTGTPDLWREWCYDPVFRGVQSGVARLRWLQHGRVQIYVLYLALTIFFLLVWYLGLGQ